MSEMSRREMLKAALALSSTHGVSNLKSASEIFLRDGESPVAFVITVPKNEMSEQSVSEIRDCFERVFRGSEYESVPVVVVVEGWKIDMLKISESGQIVSQYASKDIQ